MTHQDAQQAVTTLLKHMGEDPSRDGLIDTPKRCVKSLEFLTSGYALDAKEILQGAIFDVEYSEMVVVKDIEFYSLCEHHLVPFFGKCHVGYIPNKKVVGLSKIPRIVDVFARRLQVQERLTDQIADLIETSLEVEGVGVVMEAYHLCMMMRGVQKKAATVTSVMKGSFRKNLNTRSEFLGFIRNRTDPI